MYKRVYFIILIALLCLSISCLGRNSRSYNRYGRNGDSLPISLLSGLAGLGGDSNLLFLSNRVKAGVVSVSTVKLKKVNPKNIFFKGGVYPIADYTVPFERKGTLDYVAGKGSYVFARVVDSNGKVIRKGTSVATLNKKKVDEQVKNALKRQKLVNMGYEYMRKMTKAQENLAKKKIITSFTLEAAQMKMYSSLLDYENTTKATDDLVLSYKDENVYPIVSGLITEVYASVGDKVMPGMRIASIMQMSPILIKIKCPVRLLNLVYKKDVAMIYPRGCNVPITATLEFKQDDPDYIYINVANRIGVSGKLTSKGKTLPKVYSVFPVEKLFNENIEDFYLPEVQHKSNVLIVPIATLRHDEGGYYVYKVKGCNITDDGGEIPKYFKVEKVSVVPGEISRTINYSIDKPEKIRSIIDNGAVKLGDVLVGSSQSSLKDGSDAVLLNFFWDFYPEQLVRVQIPALTRAGIYVPRKSIIHQDENENYIYLVQRGCAVLKKVYVIGAYEDYCLISGKDIKTGERAIIVDDPILFTLLYDGRKVDVMQTDDAPVFMENKHAIDFGESLPRRQTYMNRGRGNDYFSMGQGQSMKNITGTMKNITGAMKKDFIGQVSEMF